MLGNDDAEVVCTEVGEDKPEKLGRLCVLVDGLCCCWSTFKREPCCPTCSFFCLASEVGASREDAVVAPAVAELWDAVGADAELELCLLESLCDPYWEADERLSRMVRCWGLAEAAPVPVAGADPSFAGEFAPLPCVAAPASESALFF